MARRAARRPSRSTFLWRWLALACLLLIALLYYQPVRSYFDTRQALERRLAQVRELRRERRALERRLASSSSNAELARAARQLGFVKPGERLVIVKGIGAWRRAQQRRATIARDG